MHSPSERENSTTTPSAPCATDEDALLHEALELIGDLDFEVDGSGNADDDLTRLLWDEVPGDVSWKSRLETNPSSLEDLDPQAPKWPEAFDSKPPVINRTRTRRREELLSLRGLVCDLEGRLERLRARQKEAVLISTAHVAKETEELTDAWQEVATRQSKQRQQSEMENIKLRHLLKDQIQVGKSIERLLLKKRPIIEVPTNTAQPKRFRRTNASSINRTVTYDELLGNCAFRFAETDQVVAQLHRTPLRMNVRDIRLIPDPGFGVTLQTKELRVLPFGYDNTADELWSFLPTSSTVLHTHEYHDVDHTEGTTKLQLRVIGEANRGSTELSIQIAMRRYIEANRTVIVFAGVIEPDEISDISMDGVHMRLTGWQIIEPTDTHGSVTSAATKITSYFVFVPEVDDNARDRTRKIGTFTDFLLSTIAVEFESRNQSLENRLLQRSMAAALRA